MVSYTRNAKKEPVGTRGTDRIDVFVWLDIDILPRKTKTRF
jgi:hypothetical protein